MSSFSREIRTIRALLAGSGWGVDPEVQLVLDEYSHFDGARRLRKVERRTSLQIFHASRAFDSLLEHVVRWENARPGSPISSLPRYLTLGRSIHLIQKHRINGGQFTPPTKDRLLDDLTRQRNKFMHEACSFPTDSELARFLGDTLTGLQEIISWR